VTNRQRLRAATPVSPRDARAIVESAATVDRPFNEKVCGVDFIVAPWPDERPIGALIVPALAENL